ncbi:hypothetical protein M0R45_001361 [Rubus argutus]|uniref:Uncharacterized protein n=1 Tax=Rubus argutus TaxID=59490 RepID=A0AAW1VHY6_RUBAR
MAAWAGAVAEQRWRQRARLDEDSTGWVDRLMKVRRRDEGWVGSCCRFDRLGCLIVVGVADFGWVGSEMNG